VNTILFTLSNTCPPADHRLTALRLIGPKSPEEKDALLQQALRGQAVAAIIQIELSRWRESARRCPQCPFSKEKNMLQITMTIPDESVTNLAATPDEASARLRMLAAVKLFEMKELSSGAAARLAGIPRVVFLQRLKDFGVATFQQSEQELIEEIENA